MICFGPLNLPLRNSHSTTLKHTYQDALPGKTYGYSDKLKIRQKN